MQLSRIRHQSSLWSLHNRKSDNASSGDRACKGVTARELLSEATILQAWTGMMSWYVAQRDKLDGQVRMYSNPTSDALLPDQDPRYRSALGTKPHCAFNFLAAPLRFHFARS